MSTETRNLRLKNHRGEVTSLDLPIRNLRPVKVIPVQRIS
jgi:hypothetical protein